MKPNEVKQVRTLTEVEAEVLGEGREWTRQRLEQKLPELAAETGEVFPPAAAAIPRADAPHRGGSHHSGSRLRT